MEMIALQLFVALVVLLTSDGAQSKGEKRKTSCEVDAKFCTHVSMADYNNERTIGDLLDEIEYHADFKGDSQRLINTNREVKKLLEMEAENKSELVEASRTPLEMEVNALFRLRVTCSDGRRPLIVCNETLDGVSLATLDLVDAIEEVAEGTQLSEIKEARKEFRPLYLKPPKNETVYEIVNVFGSAVLRILDSYY